MNIADASLVQELETVERDGELVAAVTLHTDQTSAHLTVGSPRIPLEWLFTEQCLHDLDRLTEAAAVIGAFVHRGDDVFGNYNGVGPIPHSLAVTLAPLMGDILRRGVQPTTTRH